MNHLEKLDQKFLLVPKALYFTLAAAFYTFHQFKGQFIVETYKMEKSSLGMYLSIPQFISFFSNMAFGALNDRSGKQKYLIVGLLALSAVFFQSFFMTSDKFTFWVLYTFYFGLISATLPLLDKVMLDYVTEIPGMGSKTFGTQRVWSTFGYLATNFTVEDLIKKVSENEHDYSNMQYFNAFVVMVSGALLFAFVKNLPRRSSSSHASSSTSLKPLLMNFEYMYFIFIILLCGISRAFMTNYLGIYHSKVLKIDKQECPYELFWPLNKLVDFCYAHTQSTTTVFGVALEIVVFFNSSYITEKLGFFWPILLSQIFQTFRFLAYYTLPHTYSNSFALCCLIEMLKGANYALIHTSALQLANNFCPPHLKTSSQFIYNGTFVAIGTVLAGLIFMGFFSKDSNDDVEAMYSDFHGAFKWNIIFSIVGILFFVAKYGIFENLLFSRENARRKISEIENRAREEEEEEQNILEGSIPEKTGVEVK